MTERPIATLALDPNVVADVCPPDVLGRLARTVDLDSESALTSFSSAEHRLAHAEILITSWGCPPIDHVVLDAAPRLRAIVHAAGTVKSHIQPAVFARGVVVSSAADANATPVAEYTVAMLVLTAKRAFTMARSYRAGEAGPGFVADEDSGIYGATVGVIGASRIGRLVLERLGAYGVKMLVADPFLDPSLARSLGAELVDVDVMCGRSDLVTVHAPELPETYHLLDARRLALLRDGAVVVNTARGSLIDTVALAKECAPGRLSAVLDVTEPEPLPADHPLHGMPNVLITPHIASARGRELRRIGEFAVAEVERFVRGQLLHGQIRVEDLTRIA